MVEAVVVEPEPQQPTKEIAHRDLPAFSIGKRQKPLIETFVE